MDPVDNPFSPGAGNRPPELAGRDDIMSEAAVAIGRLSRSRFSRSQMLLGLRGVGKTVLLNEILARAAAKGIHTAKIEAPENKKFLDKLVPALRKLVIEIDKGARVKAEVNKARVALRNFASVFKVKVGEIEFGVDPEPGVADSGELETDLTDLLLITADAARAAKKGVLIAIDEVQYLSVEELGALIVALHEVSQRDLPLTVFGAGLPQLAALAGDAKSYAERLFDYPNVGPLDRIASIAALQEPVEAAGAAWEQTALTKIVKLTQGYPFFLQEYGYQAWNLSQQETIQGSIVPAVHRAATARLDRSFFKVRIDRLTPRELDYICAMAELGPGPHRSGDIAAAMGITVQAAAPVRAVLIEKGMVYSPSHGETAFTVPMFDDYVRRGVLTLKDGKVRAPAKKAKAPAKKKAKKS
ncbi:MAG: ATPase [Alphaproteobacteria bacterium]|nr:MAG: ATPase [Alphaproteobacteria bacterium]